MTQQGELESSPQPPGCVGRRHGQTLLIFSIFVVAYFLRVNFSVGIVAMTVQSSTNDFEVLDWSSVDKGLILSSFFWGYMILQVPAGIMSQKYGPIKFLAGAMMVSGVVTVFTPLAALKGGVPAVIVTRILVGLAQGFIYPCVNAHLSKWAVPEERSRIVSFTFGGTQFGTIIMMMAGGALAASEGGWPSIFYVSGGIGILWGVVIYFFGADSPSKHKSISDAERKFVESRLVHSSNASVKVPWKELVTSVPLWALLLVNMASFWGYWTILTLLPSYINGVLGYDIANNGLLSALPYFTMWIMSIVFGVIADYINKKKIVSLNFARKMWNSIAHYGEGIALIILAFVDTDATWAIVLLTIAVSINAGTYSGYLTNHLDLSPNLAGTLMGITNGFSNISSILGPLISSYIITQQSDKGQWQVVFLVSAVIFFVGNTIFIIFGSTDVQPWNEPKTSPKQKTEENGIEI